MVKVKLMALLDRPRSWAMDVTKREGILKVIDQTRPMVIKLARTMTQP